MKSLPALALASTLWVSGLGLQAVACPGAPEGSCNGACKAESQAAPQKDALGAKPTVSLWAAPFDNQKPRQVALFGVLPTHANEGTLDRVIRVALGAGLAYVSITDPMGWGTTGRALTGVGAGVMSWTALTGACPLYLPFGIDTRF